MKDKHQKHPKMVKPNIGFYHRNEWAIYGTNCGALSKLYDQINEELSPEFSVIYVDADHQVEKVESRMQIDKKIFLTDKVRPWNEYDDKMEVFPSDVAIINGNHYPASRQVVVIDEKKKDSLHRRLEQLTQIEAVIVEDEGVEIFDFIQERMSPQTFVFLRSDISRLVAMIKSELKVKAPLKALILAGGKSSRMGEDKSQIKYHGMGQELHLAHMCTDLGLEAHLSKSYDEERTAIEGYPIIKDRMIEMGPFGAIISAMMTDPDAAWLVLACDLPLLDSETLEKLVSARNTQKLATAYKIKVNPFPEPLIAIYEPEIYPRMLQFMSLGYSCPRKVLINSDIEIIDVSDPDKLMNANTMTEKDIALERIERDGNLS